MDDELLASDVLTKICGMPSHCKLGIFCDSSPWGTSLESILDSRVFSSLGRVARLTESLGNVKYPAVPGGLPELPSPFRSLVSDPMKLLCSGAGNLGIVMHEDRKVRVSETFAQDLEKGR